MITNKANSAYNAHFDTLPVRFKPIRAEDRESGAPTQVLAFGAFHGLRAGVV